MGSNSAKMTFEEIVVQKLKDDTFMSLIGNEDALTEVVQKALQEVMFKPCIERDESYRYVKQVDSVIVQAATVQANKIAAKIAETMLDDEKIKKVIRESILELLPAAISGYLEQVMRMQKEQTIWDVKARFKSLNNE